MAVEEETGGPSSWGFPARTAPPGWSGKVVMGSALGNSWPLMFQAYGAIVPRKVSLISCGCSFSLTGAGDFICSLQFGLAPDDRSGGKLAGRAVGVQ